MVQLAKAKPTMKTGCELALTHESVPPECARHTEARWTGILYGLGVTLDSGTEQGDTG